MTFIKSDNIAPHMKPFGPFENYSAKASWAIFPRKKLDITYRDIAAGLQACYSLKEKDREEYEKLITHHWDPTGSSIVTLSIRTGFDLLLQTLKLAPGSEIICSGITIPDMLYILKYYQLVAIPVDLDPHTLCLDFKQLKNLITAKTRGILIAHVFGVQNSIQHIIDYVQTLETPDKIYIIEDCAQAFSGMEYTGCDQADVSMFSFGTIKTSTALGGAILKVKDKVIREEIVRRVQRYPIRTVGFFSKRLIKAAILHGLSTPAIYGLFLHLCQTIGADHDQVITSAIRGFSGGDLISLLRHRPSMPLLGLLYRRLTSVDNAYIQLRRAKCVYLTNAVNQISDSFKNFTILVPGDQAPQHFYWLFPVVVPFPNIVKKYMNAKGFDVTSGATQLAYVPSPFGASFDPPHAKHIMQNIIYLPVTPEMPQWVLEKMIKCFQESLQQGSRL